MYARSYVYRIVQHEYITPLLLLWQVYTDVGSYQQQLDFKQSIGLSNNNGDLQLMAILPPILLQPTQRLALVAIGGTGKFKVQPSSSVPCNSKTQSPNFIYNNEPPLTIPSTTPMTGSGSCYLLGFKFTPGTYSPSVAPTLAPSSAAPTLAPSSAAPSAAPSATPTVAPSPASTACVDEFSSPTTGGTTINIQCGGEGGGGSTNPGSGNGGEEVITVSEIVNITATDSNGISTSSHVALFCWPLTMWPSTRAQKETQLKSPTSSLAMS